MPTLPSPPNDFKNVTQIAQYLGELHRALEVELNVVPPNKDNYLLGTFTNRVDLSSSLTTAQLQEVVATLIDHLKRSGLLNANRS